MTIDAFGLFAVVGVAVVIGRNRPVLLTAVLFLVIGAYVGQEVYGQGITDSLDILVGHFT